MTLCAVVMLLADHMHMRIHVHLLPTDAHLGSLLTQYYLLCQLLSQLLSQCSLRLIKPLGLRRQDVDWAQVGPM